jgi:hypothetical protein
MINPDFSLWLGLVGSVLVAVPPLMFEWWRYRHQNLKDKTTRSSTLRQLNTLAAEQDLQITLTGWSRWQSACLVAGAILIGLSYLVQICTN